jgi:hypothetical protein
MSANETMQELAARHGMSEGAVQAARDALERGGGRLAQFSHPELGGYGQWMPGMTQIGDMFNHALRGRVEQLCQELSARWQRRETPSGAREGSLSAGPRTIPESMKPMEPMQPMKPMAPMKPMEPMKAPARWWPEELGENPNSAGGQNEARYAFFGDKQRLAFDAGDGKVEVYDTGDHRISGVQQHQGSNGRKVTFTSQHGEVELAKLQKV